jgi:hypothetical protein
MPNSEKLTFDQVRERIERIRGLWDRAERRQDHPLRFRCKDLYLSLLARSTVPDEAQAKALWRALAKSRAEMN